jgi:pSer/pThr/pTyr-binding forkhead associated (FHA) protein
MGWFAAFKRAELMRLIRSLLARLGGIVPARLRELLKLPQGSGVDASVDPQDAKTKVVHRGPFGVLISVSPPLCGTRWEIPVQGLAIGRDAECDIVVDDSRVSAHHAQIRPTDRGVVVVDAASKNGVFLNDAEHRVQGEALLEPGDIVMLSATDAAHFVFVAR